MSTTTNQTTAVSSTSKRIILSSTYRHEQRSTARQKRALKTLRRMGHFDDNDALDNRCRRIIPSADETLDE